MKITIIRHRKNLDMTKLADGGQYELASIAAPDLCTRQGTTYHSNPCASTRSVIIQSELELPLNCKYVPTAYAFSSLEAGDISD